MLLPTLDMQLHIHPYVHVVLVENTHGQDLFCNFGSIDRSFFSFRSVRGGHKSACNSITSHRHLQWARRTMLTPSIHLESNTYTQTNLETFIKSSIQTNTRARFISNFQFSSCVYVVHFFGPLSLFLYFSFSLPVRHFSFSNGALIECSSCLPCYMDFGTAFSLPFLFLFFFIPSHTESCLTEKNVRFTRLIKRLSTHKLLKHCNFITIDAIKKTFRVLEQSKSLGPSSPSSLSSSSLLLLLLLDN